MNPTGLLVLVLGILLFLSPLTVWVAMVAPAWWWPFVAWGAFIGLIALNMAGRRDP